MIRQRRTPSDPGKVQWGSMKAPVVYVPHPVHEQGLTLLAEHSEVLVGFGRDAVELEDILGSVQGILVRNGPITASHIARAPALRVIARHGIGVDNIAVDAATAHGVIVANTPQANVQSVAEHVFALLLAVTRRLPAADHAVRTGRFAHRDELVGGELSGRQLGVVGMGRIGTRSAGSPRTASACAWSASTRRSAPTSSGRGAPSPPRTCRTCSADPTWSRCTFR
jgi:D-3-phosphoglycerate dehydrogenase